MAAFLIVDTKINDEQAYEEYKRHNFNLVLLDLNLPDGFGPASVAEVRRFNKSVPMTCPT